MPNERLMQVFGFTTEDLAANRDKYLTKPQRRKLHNRRRSDCILFVVGTSIVAGFSLYFLVELTGKPRSIDQLIWSLITGVFAMMIALVGYDRWQRFSADLSKGDVYSTEGPVSLDIQSDPRGSTYKIKVGKMEWSVSKDQLLIFSNGHNYRVYYTSSSKTIMAAENLEEIDV